MNRARWLLVAIVGSYLAAGLVEPHLPNYGRVWNEAAVAHTFILMILMFAWCRADAEHRGISPGHYPFFVALFPPVGVPYYFFRTLPWRKALVASLKAVAFVLVLLIVGGVAHLLGENIAI